jgi:predicted protein tyrosine phosphatase
MVGLIGRLRRALRPLAVDIAWVTPSLALGAAPACRRLRDLRRVGLTAILDLRTERERGIDPGWADAIRRHHLKVRTLPVPDRAAPSQVQLEEGCTWVLRELAVDGRVLICCWAGSGRSATLAMAILARLGYRLPDAFALVSGSRRVANPTEAQLAALRSFAARAAPIAESGG